MSRGKQWKLSDFDKYLKPGHLAGKQITMTVTHVGVEIFRSRQREFVIAGTAPEEKPDELSMVLHFREYPKPLRVNALNRAKLDEALGEDPSALIGCKLTLRAITMRQFGGQEAIDIVKIDRPSGAPLQPAVDVVLTRESLLHKLSDLRVREKELLAERGVDPTPLTAETVKAMTDQELQERIELTESNIDNLEHA